MNDSKVVNFFLLLGKNKKSVIIISAVVVILSMLYFIFSYETYTSSCMLSLKFNSHYIIDSVEQSEILSLERPQFKSGMLDDEAINYIESIKLEKRLNGRINPYKEMLTDMNQYYMNYVFEQEFFEYVNSNGISTNNIAIENIADDISIRTHSKKKGESYEIMMKLKELIPEYIDMRCAEIIKNTKSMHESLMKSDTQKIETLIEEYQAITGNDISALEARRRILNEYACVASDYDTSYKVVRISDDLLNSDCAPEALVKSVKKDGDNKAVLLLAYLFVSIVFAIAVSVVYIYLKQFAQTVKAAKESV